MTTTKQVGPGVRLILAPNPGPMTLDGTNTWLIGEPDAPVVVVDPGPLLESHLTAIEQACPAGIATIVLTHRHLDHSEATAVLAERAGCGVRAADPAYRIGDDGLEDGAVIEAGSARLRVVATPGHTSDSRSLLLSAADGVRLLTGDMVLGRGTTVITHPDGHLASYFDSIGRMRALVDDAGVTAILPGHGPIVDDPAAWLDYYRQHRLARLEQVRAAVAAGDTTAADVVARVYADVDRSVWPAAEQSVRAQLDYLAGR